MRTTFILEVQPKVAQFINESQKDPSALVNQVIRKEKECQGMPAKSERSASYDDSVHQALEDFLDEDTFAAD